MERGIVRGMASIWLLALFFSLTLGEDVVINVKNNPRYTERHENSTIDYSTCREKSISFHEYEPEYDPEDPDYEPEPECHIKTLNTTVEVALPGVKSCCPSHGFMETAICEGRDKDGHETVFKGVQVCVSHDGSKKVEPKRESRCPLNCELKLGKLAEAELTNGNKTIVINGEEWPDFCIAIKCNNGGEEWEHRYEACGKCLEVNEVEEINKDLINSYKEELNKLGRSNAKATLCCGLMGTLDRKNLLNKDLEELARQTESCSFPSIRTAALPTTALEASNLSITSTVSTLTTASTKFEDMNNALFKKILSCNCKSKQTLEVLEVTKKTKQTDLDTLCLSLTQGKSKRFNGSVICNHDCNGNNNCIQMCMHSKGNPQALDEENMNATDIPDEYNLHAMLGVSRDAQLSTKQNRICEATTSHHITLYPDLCKDIVQFLSNGSIKLHTGVKTENNETVDIINYGEFCIQPLSGDTSKSGRYKIQTCLKTAKTNNSDKKEEEAGSSRYIIYPVVSCVSMICLLATIAVYTTWRNALLRSEYNKIMLNFAASLLLAFLSLVVMQLLDSSKLTVPVCTALTLTNQFSFLSAFCHLTLMSLNIFRQIHGMRVQANSNSRFRREVILAYTIPGVITFVTLIVELTAPSCATFRPKFGFKSCHFFGGIDKFLWLYLPILILLIINTGMFIYITYNIFKNNRRQTLSGKGGSRKEKIDKMCIYLRLFLGMGILWYFEILAFALTDIKISVNWFQLTNILNLMQGVWVFVIFVCKRNVLNVVRGTKERLYSVMQRSMSKGTRANSRGARSLDGQQSMDKTEEYSVSSVGGQAETGF